jgi:hypothetical protein
VTRHGLDQHRLTATALVGQASLISVTPTKMASSPERGSAAGIAEPSPIRPDDYTAREAALTEGATTCHASRKPLSP